MNRKGGLESPPTTVGQGRPTSCGSWGVRCSWRNCAPAMNQGLAGWKPAPHGLWRLDPGTPPARPGNQSGRGWAVFLLWLAGSVSFAGESLPTPTAEQLAFFESRVRPVLADRCYSCHSAQSDEDQGRPPARHARRHAPRRPLGAGDRPGRSGLERADPGGAVCRPGPSDAAQGRETRSRADRRPGSLGGPGGPRPAHDPRGVPRTGPYDFAQAREHWAFQRVTRPPVPAVPDPERGANPD